MPISKHVERDAKRLTNGFDDTWPRCSADRKWVFYESFSSGKIEIWKVGSDGGASFQWTGKLLRKPAISPDGKRVASYYQDVSTSQNVVNVVSFDGGEPEKTFTLPLGYYPSRICWTSDGQALTYPTV
jgi:Tol biopolymer transport system component